MNSCKGFSLPELLVAIAMISIVASAFLSSNLLAYYQRWQDRQMLAQDVSGLLSLIARARSLAMRSEQPVRLCGGEHCNGDWGQQAWLHLSGDTQVLQRHQLSSDTSMVWRGFPAQRAYIEFLPNGLSSYQNGSFYLCRAQAHAQRILVNQSGRAYLDSQSYEVEECL
ncbi:hypothetical protein MAQ5080_00517 [Marinomonas aquimarina]|uniref:Type II secretion system protein H n=1 Tax=Marinomonas aquimarina TaxID=295068 RepID=A0A1A8T2W1_9GAMM|nr:GspH/FimT family pseudopilin [Marinomonas aquimarina]SBS26429.1 hypothetical protein MAQ5080_00517 [Marinomonas aquimarina]